MRDVSAALRAASNVISDQVCDLVYVLSDHVEPVLLCSFNVFKMFHLDKVLVEAGA